HISCEKAVSLVWKIVDYLKKENINNFAFQKDSFLCPYCMGFLYEPITLSCGHTYCKMCAINGTIKACLVCNTTNDTSAPEINVLISSLLEKWWSKEMKGISLRTEGETFIKEKKYSKALKTFTEARELVPSDHILLCRRSQVNLILGNDQDALRDACEATLHRPEWAMGYFCKSNALLALGREEDALVAMFVYALLANPEDGERVHYEVAKLILLILRRSAVRADGAQAFLSASRRDRRCPKEIEKAAAESLRAKRKKRRSSSIKTSFHHFITEDVPVVARVMSRLSSEVSKIKNCVNSYKVTVNNSVSHSSDFECPLCFLCFWEPVTTVCGHTFCRACLARSLDHASQCPLCKTSLRGILEVKPFNDGRSIVHAVGTRRFRCVTKSMRDGYNTSTIEYIEDKVVSDEDLPKLQTPS
ncbi:LON peptidase N-terminal domain and RING finger protein 3, partial [Armadillidium nasatum]